MIKWWPVDAHIRKCCLYPVWILASMDAQMDEWMYACVCMSGCVDGWVDVCLDVWMHGPMWCVCVWCMELWCGVAAVLGIFPLKLVMRHKPRNLVVSSELALGVPTTSKSHISVLQLHSLKFWSKICNHSFQRSYSSYSLQKTVELSCEQRSTLNAGSSAACPWSKEKSLQKLGYSFPVITLKGRPTKVAYQNSPLDYQSCRVLWYAFCICTGTKIKTAKTRKASLPFLLSRFYPVSLLVPTVCAVCNPRQYHSPCA